MINWKLQIWKRLNILLCLSFSDGWAPIWIWFHIIKKIWTCCLISPHYFIPFQGHSSSLKVTRENRLFLYKLFFYSKSNKRNRLLDILTVTRLFSLSNLMKVFSTCKTKNGKKIKWEKKEKKQQQQQQWEAANICQKCQLGLMKSLTN